jgi:hypothetical protein
MDLIFLALTAGLFGLALGLVALCDRLGVRTEGRP